MRTERIEIYPNHIKEIEREKGRLETAPISNRNRTLIKGFLNHIYAKGSGQKRACKLSIQLRKLALWVNMDFDKFTRDDLESLMARIGQDNSRAPNTRADYRRTVKQFFIWFQEKDLRLDSESREERLVATKMYRYLKHDIRIGYQILKADFKDILTDEEVNTVLREGCQNIRDMAMIKILHESGCRSGELLNMRLGDVTVKEKSAIIRVDGKTGPREIPIVQSVAYLVQWINQHPHKSNPYAPIWASRNPARMHECLTQFGASKLIHQAFARAKVNKRHNMHWFRHSRASLLAPRVPEVVLCKYMGWTIGSKQIRNYSHLCSKQVEDSILSLQGIKPIDDDSLEKPRTCSCGCVNPEAANHCYRCGKPLDVSQLLREERQKEDILTRMLSELGGIDDPGTKEEAINTVKAFLKLASKPGMLAKLSGKLDSN